MTKRPNVKIIASIELSKLKLSFWYLSSEDRKKVSSRFSSFDQHKNRHFCDLSNFRLKKPCSVDKKRASLNSLFSCFKSNVIWIFLLLYFFLGKLTRSFFPTFEAVLLTFSFAKIDQQRENFLTFHLLFDLIFWLFHTSDAKFTFIEWKSILPLSMCAFLISYSSLARFLLCPHQLSDFSSRCGTHVWLCFEKQINSLKPSWSRKKCF